MSAETISLIISIVTIVTLAYKTVTDARRGNVDIYTKAAQALIKPLNERIEDLEAKTLRDDIVIGKMLTAIFLYLNDRQDKLKNYPGCGPCLTADDNFRQKINVISRERDVSITKPLKDV